MRPFKMTVLVVGGAGYIGSHTVKQLLDSNYQVIVFDNLSTGHADHVPKECLWIGDLSDHEALDRCFQSHQIDTVIHLAASSIISESVSHPNKYFQNNTKNTHHLLFSMQKHDVKKIIFSSTASVYGYPEQIPIDINHPKNPINPYGHSKLQAEQLIVEHAKTHGLQYIFLRYFKQQARIQMARSANFMNQKRI